MAKKKSGSRKKKDYKIGGKKLRKEVKKGKQEEKIEDVMQEFKEKKLRSGSKRGPKVKSRKQAIAISLSESRKVGKKRKKRGAKKK